MTTHDIKQVADRALDSIDTVLSHWLPQGSYQGKEYIALNPTRSDNTKGSFSVNRNTGAWSDFATQDSGGDLVALVAYVERVNQGKACQILANFLGLQPVEPANTNKQNKGKAQGEWQAIMPVPESALASLPDRHYQNGKPSQVWTYRDDKQNLLMQVMRFDKKKAGERRKDYRPLTYCQHSTSNKQQWRWQQPKHHRPLYGLEYLAAQPHAKVIITEGEKAADAARELLPDYVCMTWAGGSKALGKTDFSPLQNRQVILWPDNDTAGKECMQTLANTLDALECNLGIIDLSGFGEHWPDKADAADAKAHGFDTKNLLDLLADNQLIHIHQQDTQPNQSNPAITEQAHTSRFLVTDKGVFFRNDGDDDGGLMRICNRLDIVALTRDKQGRNWGMLVRFTDPDHQQKEWNIPSEYLATEGGAEVLRQLFSLGLRAESGQQPRRRLIQYLQTSQTEQRYTLVNRLGWHGNAYLLPDITLGQPEEPLYFYSDSPNLNKIGTQGELEQWQQNIAALCVGNPLLVFALSAALAAPLLNLIGMETTGFHFFGDSSQGKTTLLKIAASVYGSPDYVRTWRSTDNALESIAAAHSDGLLILDEISQCDPRIVGDIAYLLGNGKGKARANDRGSVRGGALEWRLLFLSTGEKTLDQHMAEAGKKTKAGQEVRLLAIPADAGEQKGIFNELHNFAGGAALSNHLVKESTSHHGTPFYEFIRQLCQSDHHKLADRLRRELVNFGADIQNEASGQVKRAGDKFALVGFAGELATHAGITGWPKGEAKQAAKVCFERWIQARGGTGNLEDQQILSQIKLFFESHGEARFTRWDRDDTTVDEHGVRTMNRCGYRKTLEDNNPLNDAQCDSSDQSKTSETIYYVFLEAFKTEICYGLNSNKAKALLAECGALDKDSEGKYTKPVRLPSAGRNKQRVLVIKPHLIVGSDQETLHQNQQAA